MNADEPLGPLKHGDSTVMVKDMPSSSPASVRTRPSQWPRVVLGVAAVLVATMSASLAGATPSAVLIATAGGKLVIESEAGELLLADADGSAERSVSTRPVAGAFPRWSRDGRRIAFLGPGGGGTDIYVVPANGGAEERVTFTSAPEGPSAWGRGDELVFARGRGRAAEIVVLNVGTGLARRLTRNRVADTEPAMSPYGAIAFASTRQGGPPRLYRMSAAGTRVVALTRRPGGDSAPVWAPNGRELAFIRTRGGDTELYRIASNGTGVRRLTSTPQRRESQPTWSPEGSKIIFRGCEADESGSLCRLFAINPDGTGEEPLAVAAGLGVRSFDVQRPPIRRFWDAAADFQREPYQRNPSPDEWGDLVWSYHSGATGEAGLDPLLPYFAMPFQTWTASPYNGNLADYHRTTPLIGSTGPRQPLAGGPGWLGSVIVAWRSPIVGAVDISGSVRPVSLQECGFNGDGVGSVVDKDGVTLARGRMPPGVEWRFELPAVEVAFGTLLRFTIDAGEQGHFACDTTVVQITIRER